MEYKPFTEEQLKKIFTYMAYIKGCVNVVRDNKGDVFTTGVEMGQILIYLDEIDKIKKENGL